MAKVWGLCKNTNSHKHSHKQKCDFNVGTWTGVGIRTISAGAQCLPRCRRLRLRRPKHPVHAALLPLEGGDCRRQGVLELPAGKKEPRQVLLVVGFFQLDQSRKGHASTERARLGQAMANGQCNAASGGVASVCIVAPPRPCPPLPRPDDERKQRG